jgi:predicted negative regulator of RcsB-dependent stress response
VDLLNDVAAPLGTDVTLAMDSGLAPILAIEVNDPTHLQQTLQTLVQRFNQQMKQQTAARIGALNLTSVQVNGRTFYSISNANAPGLSVYYTFVDGYLLASSSQANVLTAIQNKQSGHVLADSAAFRAKLPADGYANFSAMIYSNMGSSLGSLAKQLKPSGQQQQQAVTALLSQGGSGLICVYGEADKITAAARGSFLGFDLGTLVGIQQGKPLQTIIAHAPAGKARGIAN